MISKETVKRGLWQGLTTTWELARIMVPIFLAITILKHTGWLTIVARLFAPAMAVFGLPGEAALALVLGFFLGTYGGIGAMVTMSLTGKQLTILALMILFCHNVPVETAVTQRTGVFAWRFLFLRVAVAVVCGVALNLIL